MIWLSRILLLLAFALFWGGLTFYTGLVVRVIHDVLADPLEGGLITQRVTAGLQYLGIVTVGLMFVNAFLVARKSNRYGYSLVACAVIVGIAIIGLVMVHGQLDAVIDADGWEITDRDAFTIGHRRYNQLTTIEWVASLAYLSITIAAWRRIDASQDS